MQHGEVSGKTYLVTGSTDGIGRHTASKLVAAGANVLLHGRTQEKVTATKRDLDSIAKGNKISSYTYNLASFSQIRKFAEAIRANHNNIDVLINNAGVFETQRSLSEDGYEMTWAINVLAPFLLTSLLKDVVTDRIVNVSSISAGSSIDFDNLQQEKGFSSHNSYSLSKLASMMFTCDLAEHMKPKGVTVNCLDPGTVNTKMLIAGWGACGIDVKDANYEYKLATDPSLAKETGKYYVNGRESRLPAVAKDQKFRKRLWQIMTDQTGAIF
ncbi:MAG: short chain dehydrogenase reductase family [Trebouxia sp. A1-2]|nr:MAG: short chain dehydrogenase reductase family [Trebouxia sp. A1-2]